MAHAAVQHRAVAHHVLGEAQHLQTGQHRLEGFSVERAKHIECGSAPTQQVWRRSSGQPTRSGTTESGSAIARSLTPSNVDVHGCGDQLLSLVVDGVAHRP